MDFNLDFNPLAVGITAPWLATHLYSILSSYGIILSLWNRADVDSDRATADNTQDHFDFIIVGGGSAGGLVAHRLSKDYDVLLLEAGGEPTSLSRITGFMEFFKNYPESDWGHKTVPQKYACGNARNRQCTFNAGIGLGGTGNLNAAVHIRGHSRDFDAWANLTGDPSWGFDEVIQHFKSYEHFAVKNDSKVDLSFHGTGGDIQVERPEFTGLANVFTSAANELGFPTVDLNGGRFDDGFDALTFSTKNGVRQVSYAAFIHPAREKQSLNIRKFALVSKIIFKNDAAKGVEYIRHGKTYTAYAKNEIILSAGAFGTPKILMLSGIGPKDHLDELGIPVIKNLPVGKRLMDHGSVGVGPFFADISPIPTPDVNEFRRWLTEGKGILSSSNVRASGLITSTISKSNGEVGWPDIQYFLRQAPVYTNVQSATHGNSLKLDEYKAYFNHPNNQQGKASFTIDVSLARPKSRGYVKLGGSSIYDDIIIDPNYLNPNVNNGSDREVVLEGIKIALELVENTTAFNNIGAIFTNVSYPRCENLEFRSDAYFYCFISHLMKTIHHFCGTAAMGAVGDPDAVVDNTLRVQGIKGLRVVDASVFPLITASNSQAPVLMVAEKASKMILKDWEFGMKMEL